MASLSLYRHSETNLMSNRKVIELLLQLTSANAHGKNNIKLKPHLVRHLLRNRLLNENLPRYCPSFCQQNKSDQENYVTDTVPSLPCNQRNIDILVSVVC